MAAVGAAQRVDGSASEFPGRLVNHQLRVGSWNPIIYILF